MKEARNSLKSKNKKSTRFAHTPKSPKGLGDYYGTGFVAKIGKQIRGVGIDQLDKSKLKKPPKQLA